MPRTVRPSSSTSLPFSNGFYILEFLILATVAGGEKYSYEVIDELCNLGVPIELPKHSVIYMRLKDLVRAQLLTSRQQYTKPRRIYFSITPKGSERVNALCALAHRLDALAWAAGRVQTGLPSVGAMAASAAMTSPLAYANSTQK